MIPSFIVVISALIFDRRGRILLLKRSRKNKTFKGFWQLPEGKINFGEQIKEALKRELKEELGLKLVKEKIINTTSTLITVASQKFHLLRIIFLTETKGNVVLSKEHSNFRWLALKKAAKLPNLFPGTREIFKLIKRRDSAKLAIKY